MNNEEYMAVIGICKCEHYWFIRKQIPKYCPKCHRRTDESSRFIKVIEPTGDELQSHGIEPIKARYTLLTRDCVKPGTPVSDIIKKEENEQC
jgi:hypothetical protein